MQNRNRQIYAVTIGVTIVLVTQIMLRILDNTKWFTQVVIAFLTFISFIYPVIILSYKDKLLGRKLNIIGSVITSTTCLLISLLLIMLEFFSNLVDKYLVLTTILWVLCFISFLTLIIFWIVVANKIIEKNRE
jgi:Na+(H+)/acetate symporter ActP